MEGKQVSHWIWLSFRKLLINAMPEAVKLGQNGSLWVISCHSSFLSYDTHFHNSEWHARQHQTDQHLINTLSICKQSCFNWTHRVVISNINIKCIWNEHWMLNENEKHTVQNEKKNIRFNYIIIISTILDEKNTVR